jgi:hypothetical protein
MGIVGNGMLRITPAGVREVEADGPQCTRPSSSAARPRAHKMLWFAKLALPSRRRPALGC